jgi:tetratricopeptide (TPR) repeat protein
MTVSELMVTMTIPARIARRLEAARGYLLLEMPDQALAELNEIDDRTFTEFEWHLLKGEALRGRGDFRAAITAFQRCQRIRLDTLDVLMGLAWCYKRTDQLHKSIEAMHQAYLSHRDEPIVLYNLSCYYALADNKEQALSWLGRALRMRPELRTLIAAETDFDSIRNDADFQHLIELTEPGRVV